MRAPIFGRGFLHGVLGSSCSRVDEHVHAVRERDRLVDVLGIVLGVTLIILLSTGVVSAT